MLVLRQYRSALVYLLLGAGVLAFLLGHRTDSWVILAIVTANALLGAFQEGRAERSMAALRRLSASHTRILRGGREREIEARAVVPGDVMLLAAGDAIAADARLIEAASLDVAAAALTGESQPVRKVAGEAVVDTPLADRGGMVYAATQVARGRGRAIVVATGLATEVGKIASLTAMAVEPQTPLGRRIAGFGRVLVYAGTALSITIIALGLARGMATDAILMLAVSQLVAVVPEGLPVAVTVALALGARRIAERGALVRRLIAVETLGSTTVICSDKTGTLTSNEMCVTAACLASGRALDVTGTGYAPEGRLEARGEVLTTADPDVRALVEAVILCNDGELAPPSADEPRWRALGDPTEAALLTFAAKAGASVSGVRAVARRRGEIPFDAETKIMATWHERDSGTIVVVKGAAEKVLERCSSRQVGGRREPLDDKARSELQRAWEDMADRALRVLAVAVAVVPAGVAPRLDLEEIRDATLLGLVGQTDPMREGAREAVERCRKAGILVLMLTGDHEATARAIARTLGILGEGERVLGGSEIGRLDDTELTQALEKVTVFARVHPAQKLRIVKSLQARGEVVAMTGDGVNDAPALASADVGVAMGRIGTEVAKMASKIVLTDDAFPTIVGAIEEGRAIHENLKSLILYLVSTSAAGVLVLLSALAVGLPAPLAAVQILWVNLVTDGVVAIPLSTGIAGDDLMQRPPVPTREPLVTRALFRRAAIMVPAMVLSTLGWFSWRVHSGTPLVDASTEAFTVLAACQWYNALNCRSHTQSVLRMHLGQDRFLLLGIVVGVLLQAVALSTAVGNHFLHTTSLPLSTLGALVLAASPVLVLEELRKLAARHLRKRREPADGKPQRVLAARSTSSAH
jgi:magnesium-transporting ATPase (P-type)